MQNYLRKFKLLYPYKAFYKVPYLVPPWGEDEVKLFWDYWANPQHLPSDTFEEGLKKGLKVDANIFLVDSGRSALRALFRELSFPKGSEIIIPVLCCGAVPGVIKESGLVPSLADIGPDLCLTVDNIKKSISPKTKGVMLVHAGGAAASEYDRIAEFCSKNGLYFIDNAAPAWGNRINGIWLGGQGDSGVISFGLGKSTFGPGGGMLISKLSKVKGMGEHKLYNKAGLMLFYLKYLKRGYTAPLFMYAEKLMKGIENNDVRAINPFDRAIQSSIFKDLSELIKKRTAISLEVMSILDKKPASFPQRNNPHTWTKLIIKLPEKLRNIFQEYLYMHRIETEDYHCPFHLRSEWSAQVRSNPSGYPAAEQAYRELLVIPNSPGLTEAQLNYLYKVIKKFKEGYL